MFSYELEATDGAARAGTFTTPHGALHTPAFMPVGTLGTVKSVSMPEVRDLGAEMVLANTYHLYLRPGHGLVRQLGGLHDFIGYRNVPAGGGRRPRRPRDAEVPPETRGSGGASES